MRSSLRTEELTCSIVCISACTENPQYGEAILGICPNLSQKSISGRSCLGIHVADSSWQRPLQNSSSIHVESIQNMYDTMMTPELMPSRTPLHTSNHAPLNQGVAEKSWQLGKMYHGFSWKIQRTPIDSKSKPKLHQKLNGTLPTDP